MLKNIENCTDARLYTIYKLANEGIKWAEKNPQLKDIKEELKRRKII